jgi:glyoxylase-like metal-dependent hydrolase (beta-lactamase superfamily II)/rhodanese-related sulfurtransferase
VLTWWSANPRPFKEDDVAFADDNLIPLVDEGLGNSAYLVDLGEGRGLAVDASRDVRALRQVADRRGLEVAFAADTHLHADFLSGAVQLAHDEGATVLASAAGHRHFEHRGLADGDEVDLGGLTLRAVATPGHTDEHISFLLLDGRQELGVFSGGSLIVNSAARTDLLGPERTDELARAQFRSLSRLSQLPDEVALWPTHGAGSFCSAPPGTMRTSTIGEQKKHNPLLAVADEDAFVKQLLCSLGSYPKYFDRLSGLNRIGPAVILGDLSVAALDVAAARAVLAEGGELVDVRPPADYASSHIPGSISIPLRDQFATWLGWVVPEKKPLLFVVNPDQDLADLAWQAYKVGYEDLAGYLKSGLDAWRAAGGEVRATEFVTPAETAGRPVVDIRQQSEYVTGHIPGAQHVELAQVCEREPDVKAGAVVACGHGERAMTAASLLERAGRHDIAALDGGPGDWSDTFKRHLVEGDQP